MATNSSREQSAASSHIADSMEQINNLIQNIQSACVAQSEESKHILNAITDIEKSTQDNLETSEAINKVVPRLTGQVVNLKEEMQFFQIEQSLTEIKSPKQEIRGVSVPKTLASLQ